jgi:D-alanyl-lipoteichoic acid acyltransferase DltB (MBOAT superfamily)
VLFNSYEFIFCFLPVVVAGYFWLNSRRWMLLAKGWLVISSLFFYAWWNINYVPLILGSITFNFLLGKAMREIDSVERIISQKALLLFGLAANIILLGYYKYTDFFIDNYNTITGSQLALLHIMLPLGISFFTITQITFLVDCYEGLVKELDILNYMLFVTFFPHLLMGPILHHKQMMPQFDDLRTKGWQHSSVAQGCILFILGLGKKVLLADSFAVWADRGFSATASLPFWQAWAASLAYTFQLYFDFSGYSDMALGAALLFNIRLPINFNTPLKSRSIIEFWQRWHISLTTFITTYLYTPILKSFKHITFRNAMLSTFPAMLIAGIWHEARWGFLIFYTLHASALVLNHSWRKRKLHIPKLVAWLLTFNFINITLVFMRAQDVQSALQIIKDMGRFFPQGTIPAGVEIGGTKLIIYLTVGFILAVCGVNSQEFAERIKLNWTSAIVLVILLLAATLQLNEVSKFLYFQF